MSFSTYRISRAIPLRNSDYFPFIKGKIGQARKRIWAAVFIVNPIVDEDKLLAVRGLIKDLAYAKWRNVDVRVIIGTSSVRDIAVANDTALAYLGELGVPTVRFSGKRRKSLHSKYVIVDDELVVAGSHNWSPGAADLYNEDSIAVYSDEMNLLLRDEFIHHWEHAKTTNKGEQNEESLV